mmetsp:Transcript_81581/g.162338  ORF Transcript_81581/g.162338 Transcript_81581/m.162338 type:complete len:181 (-) Transcript_81581:66-608(-)
MELFTFVHLTGGGTRELSGASRKATKGVGPSKATHSERIVAIQIGEQDVWSALCNFDASKAQCFLLQDRDRLLAIIEASFGDLPTFSTHVRAIVLAGFQKVMHRRRRSSAIDPRHTEVSMLISTGSGACLRSSGIEEVLGSSTNVAAPQAPMNRTSNYRSVQLQAAPGSSTEPPVDGLDC